MSLCKRMHAPAGGFRRRGPAFARRPALLIGLTLLLAMPCPAARATPPDKSAAPAKPKDRAAAAAASLSRLGLGEGAAVADVGSGRGQDTWNFAKIVGSKGTVYAEEISEGSVKALKKEAEKRGLSQVHPVLGREDDPCLPAGSADLVFMHFVYHHFAKPCEMLRGIWKSLRPGGYFVVVDRERGTLRNWVERKVRSKKHYWIAETTVVREAREEGFRFVGLAEDCWHEKDPFVLVFQRPKLTAKTTASPGKQAWEIPAEKLLLEFEKQGEGNVVTGGRTLE